MLCHIEGLVVSDKMIFFMFSYLAYVNHVTTGRPDHFWPEGHKNEQMW